MSKIVVYKNHNSGRISATTLQYFIKNLYSNLFNSNKYDILSITNYDTR